ncbi:hypothetical protein HZD82_28145, partial [Pantoea agglomerans]|nr:hypothetical protein [Pantoea agglomerans]
MIIPWWLQDRIEAMTVVGLLMSLWIIVLTLAILFWLIWLFNETPGTDDAYVYADTITIAPQVNGVI